MATPRASSRRCDGRSLSIVTNTSNEVAASRSSSPFFLPAQPASATVWTWCPTRSAFSLRGRHSSSRTRIAFEGLSSQLQHGDSLLAGHGRKVLQELVDAVAGFEAVDQGLHRDSCPSKHRGSAQDLLGSLDHA